MPKVWVNGHHLKGRGDVNFGHPSAATCVFNHGNGLVDVVIMKRKFFERNEAVDARERGVMRGREIDYEAFFIGKFSGSYTYGTNAEGVKWRIGKGADHEICVYFFLNKKIDCFGFG